MKFAVALVLLASLTAAQLTAKSKNTNFECSFGVLAADAEESANCYPGGQSCCANEAFLSVDEAVGKVFTRMDSLLSFRPVSQNCKATIRKFLCLSCYENSQSYLNYPNKGDVLESVKGATGVLSLCNNFCRVFYDSCKEDFRVDVSSESIFCDLFVEAWQSATGGLLSLEVLDSREKCFDFESPASRLAPPVLALLAALAVAVFVF